MKITHHPASPKGPASRLGGVHNQPQMPAQGAAPGQMPATPQPTDVPPELASAIAAGRPGQAPGY